MSENQKITILSVDDNDANLYARSRLLKRQGYEIVEASNGADALRLVAELKPPLVLCDVQMPGGINGLEVCRQIKSNPALISTFVLQISASLIEPEDKASALDGGADAFLTEPVEPEELLATVRALLRLQRAEADLRNSQNALAAALIAERQARAAAENATRLKDEFLAVVSHELRSPLNAILGWNQLLQRGADAATVARAAAVIDRQGALQVQLIEDLLDTSRIVSGKMRLETQSVEMGEIILAAVDTVRPAAEAKKILLLPDLEINPGQITGDADRLQQIIWNLLINAVKFTPSGGTVFIELRRESSQLVVAVRDTGQGIEPEFLPFVFDRFRQADASTTRRSGGLGLGLALARHLVELHGGTIDAASAGANLGTTFTARFPLRAVSAPPKFSAVTAETSAQMFAPPKFSAVTAETSAQMFAPPTDSIRLSNVRALVIDDEADSRELIAATLNACGATTQLAASGAEALEFLINNSENPRFNIVICDVGMPEMDGYAVIAKIRALTNDYHSIPAIALTAYVRAADRVQVLDAGFQEHLSKPVKAEFLLKTIDLLCNSVR